MYASTGIGLGDARPITTPVGSGLMVTGGLIAAIPGGQLPGAIIAAVGALTSLVGSLFKPDLTKIEATHIVDQIELQVLKPMLASWQNLRPEQKTLATQQAYLNTFDQAWAAVLQGCRNPALGEAGQACIVDRDEAGRWPWKVYYRDPIANDPEVQADPVSSAVEGFQSAFQGASPLPLLLMGGLLIWAVAS